MKFFDAVKEEMGDVPIIAEDLGVFGEDVTQLLDKTRFPGMRVIQFGFDPCGNSTHLPHNYPLNTVAYVGTHDNTTLRGFGRQRPKRAPLCLITADLRAITGATAEITARPAARLSKPCGALRQSLPSFLIRICAASARMRV